MFCRSRERKIIKKLEEEEAEAEGRRRRRCTTKRKERKKHSNQQTTLATRSSQPTIRLYFLFLLFCILNNTQLNKATFIKFPFLNSNTYFNNVTILATHSISLRFNGIWSNFNSEFPYYYICLQTLTKCKYDFKPLQS